MPSQNRADKDRAIVKQRAEANPKLVTTGLVMNAMIFRAVAYALCLFLTGRFAPPKLELLESSLVKTSLRRTDQSDDGELSSAIAQADLFAQLAELKALGHPLPSQSANSGHYEFLDELDGAVSQARLWSSVIRTIARKLMVDGVVLPNDFDRMTQMGNASC
jgi:hypothetical protein